MSWRWQFLNVLSDLMNCVPREIAVVKKHNPNSFSWSSDHLQKLLREKHQDDVFVGECNTGSSWGHNIRRLDAWAMKRSWSPWETIGYEIKVSRQDFLKDEKWVEYLAYCHKFYFVCPPGLIRASDLPQGIGLLWGTMSGTKVMTKVPAVRREVDVNAVNKLLTYVLMSRAWIVANMNEANDPSLVLGADKISLRDKRCVEAMEKHAREADARGELAVFVADHVRRRIAEADDKLKAAQIIEKKIAEFDEMLAERGLEWKDKRWMHAANVVRQSEILAGVVDKNSALLPMGRQALNSLGRFLDEYDLALNSTERHGDNG
jgi:hypothetical protein